MTNSEFFKKLKEIKSVTPDARWIASNREVLLSSIKDTSVSVKEKNWKNILNSTRINFGFFLDIILPHRFINTFGQPAVISFAGIFFIISSMAAVGYSRDTVPGNVLYPVKIVGENIQLVLNTKSEDKVKLEIDFAGRRVTELRKLVEVNKLSTKQVNEKINQVTIAFENNIKTVGVHLDEIGVSEEAGVALEIAKNIDKKVAEYSLALNNINITADKNDKTKVVEALSQAEEISNKALSVIVAKHGEVKDGISDLEVAEKLNNKIAFAENQIIEEDQEEAGKIFSDAKSLVGSGDFVAALAKITEGKDIVKKIREEMKANAKTKVESEDSKINENIVEEITDVVETIDETIEVTEENLLNVDGKNNNVVEEKVVETEIKTVE